jgi:hypothetical protein
MGPRAGMNIVAKKKSYPAGNRTPAIHVNKQGPSLEWSLEKEVMTEKAETPICKDFVDYV